MPGRFARMLLAAAPWPLARAIFAPEYRRVAGRRRTAGAALYLALHSFALALAMRRRPRLAALIAAIGGLATALQAWMARDTSGRRERLPPGALPTLALGSVLDRDFVRKELDRNGPVTKVEWLGIDRPIVCVRGLRRGAGLLREHAADLSWVGNSFDPLVPGGFIRSMSPSDHRRYKPLFRRAFADDAVVSCHPRFRTEARVVVSELAAEAARASDGSVDPRRAVGQITIRSHAALFFGVLSGTSECAAVEALALDPAPLYSLPAPGERGFDDLRKAALRLIGIIRGKASELDDPHVANSFLGRLLGEHPEALDDPKILFNLPFLFATASRDVTGLLGWTVKLLGENPDWIARVRADAGDLDRRVVMETLRLAQSEYISRRALRSIEFGGYRIPKDWYVRVCVNEAHRDPGVFDRPEEFDPERFAHHRYTTAEYAPFGMYEHACLGVVSTHSLASAFVREFCEYDWRVCQDDRPAYDGFHWAPSRRLRLRLAAS